MADRLTVPAADNLRQWIDTESRWLHELDHDLAAAADLIEAQQAEIVRLRAAGHLLEDAFAQTWGNCWCHDPEIEPLVVRAFAAWQEARRG